MDCLICSKSRAKALKDSSHLDDVLSALGEMFPSFNWIDYSELIIICVNCTKQLAKIKCKVDQIAKLQEEVIELKGKVEDSLWIGKDHTIATSQASQSIRNELLKGIETRRALKVLEDAEPSDDSTDDPRSPDIMDIGSVEVIGVASMDQVIRDSQSFVVSYESQDIPQPCGNEVEIGTFTNNEMKQKSPQRQGSSKISPIKKNPKDITPEKLISQCLKKRAVVKLQKIRQVSYDEIMEGSQESNDMPEPFDDWGDFDDSPTNGVQPELNQSPKRRPKKMQKKKRVFVCSCGESYPRKDLLIAHRRSNNCTGMCETCGKQVLNLDAHLKTHEAKILFQCDKCPAQLRSKKRFKIHVLKHDEGNYTLKCEQCELTFVDKPALNYHVKRIHDTKKMACDQCGLVMRENHLKFHKKQVHEQDFKYFCPKEGCGKGFIRQSGLTNHLLWHSSDQKRPKNIKCRFCPKLFTLPSARCTHEKIHKNKMLECEMCDLKCPDRYSLNRHMETHSSVRRWKCRDCGADFKVKAYLVHHQRRDCDPSNKPRKRRSPSPRRKHKGKSSPGKRNRY